MEFDSKPSTSTSRNHHHQCKSLYQCKHRPVFSRTNRIQQSRRTRSNELNDLDNPEFGLLIKIKLFLEQNNSKDSKQI